MASLKKSGSITTSMIKPLRWFLTNRYVHLRSFLGPSLEDAAVPKRLRERLKPRLESAMRLAKWRAVFFVMVYAAVLGTAGAAIADYLASVFGGGLFTVAGQAFATIVAFAALFAAVGLIGVFLVNRALALLEAEIYVLGMEVVSLCVKKGDANLPSGQQIKRRFT